jgi:hypothetical protein
MTRSATAGFGRFSEASGETTTMRWVRRIVIAIVSVHVTLAAISGYRAIVQVYSLDVRATSDTIRAGARVGLRVTISARTNVHAWLILLQGARAETLGVRLVKDNGATGDVAYNPFPKRDSMFVTVGPEVLGRFTAGPAVLRAVAVGGPQWMRTPPPTVRERQVVVIK